MQPFESLGTFWISGDPDSALPGRLIFDPLSGITLQLIGSFPLTRVTRGSDPAAGWQVHGAISTGLVTLGRCYQADSNGRFPGISESSFFSNYMLLGYHADSPNEAFQSVTLHSPGAADWIGARVLGDRTPSESNVNPFPVDWIRYVPPPDQDIAFGKGKLRMYFGWAPKGAGSVESVSFSHWPVFRLDYSEPRAMDELLKDVKRLEDLVTLCSNEATVAVKLTFLRPDIKTRLLSGEDGPDAQKIEYLAPQLLASKLATRRTLHPHQMLLTFAELGGMDAVARWLDFAPRVSRSLDSLMSVKYSPHIYMQNRFLNVAFAAEAFHRDFNGLGETLPMNIFGDLSAKYHQVTPDSCRSWLRQILLHVNDTTFRNRLKALVRQADDAIVGLVGDPRSWINAVTKVRNDLTHLDSSHSEFENDDLFYLSESMYSLIRLCMLLEIGAPKRVLRDKALGYRLTWYKERLREAIIRIEAR